MVESVSVYREEQNVWYVRDCLYCGYPGGSLITHLCQLDVKVRGDSSSVPKQDGTAAEGSKGNNAG